MTTGGTGAGRGAERRLELARRAVEQIPQIVLSRYTRDMMPVTAANGFHLSMDVRTARGLQENPGLSGVSYMDEADIYPHFDGLPVVVRQRHGGEVSLHRTIAPTPRQVVERLWSADTGSWLAPATQVDREGYVASLIMQVTRAAEDTGPVYPGGIPAGLMLVCGPEGLLLLRRILMQEQMYDAALQGEEPCKLLGYDLLYLPIPAGAVRVRDGWQRPPMAPIMFVGPDSPFLERARDVWDVLRRCTHPGSGTFSRDRMEHVAAEMAEPDIGRRVQPATPSQDDPNSPAEQLRLLHAAGQEIEGLRQYLGAEAFAAAEPTLYIYDRAREVLRWHCTVGNTREGQRSEYEGVPVRWVSSATNDDPPPVVRLVVDASCLLPAGGGRVVPDSAPGALRDTARRRIRKVRTEQDGST